MTDATMTNPLPELPDSYYEPEIAKRPLPKRAHAAAEVSAARDCRTCANLTSVKTCRHRRFGEEQCIDADKYEALPPVRLWRESK